jgi:hypothetical protein
MIGISEVGGYMFLAMHPNVDVDLFRDGRSYAIRLSDDKDTMEIVYLTEEQLTHIGRQVARLLQPVRPKARSKLTQRPGVPLATPPRGCIAI